MNKTKNFLINTFFILLITCICMFTITKMCENDLFFDIRTGKDILKYGIDFKDHFSFIPNLTYLYHHWLYDLLIYAIYKYFSYGGIYILFLINFSLLGISIYFANKKYTNNTFLSFIVSIVTILICNFCIVTRVQAITYLLFFLETYFLERLYQTGLKRYTIFLLLNSIIILNFHMPLWLFSIILTIPFMIEMFLKLLKDNFKLLKKINSQKIVLENTKNIPLFIITYLLLILSGLISPYRLQPYTFFLKVLGNKSYDIILEMQKTVIINYPILLIILLITLFIIIVLNVKIKLRDLLLFTGLFLFSLLANRNIIFIFLLMPTLITKILSYNFKLPTIKLKWKLLKKIYNFLLIIINNNYIITSCIVLLIISIILGIKTLNLKTFNFLIDQEYPVQSVKYIKKNLDYKNIKLYTEFNYGSFIAFNDIPIFIDSRAEVYIKEFNGGQDIITDYKNIGNYFSYKSIFNKYDFDYALVYYGTDIAKSLERDNDYEILYNEDNIFILFGKKLNKKSE